MNKLVHVWHANYINCDMSDKIYYTNGDFNN